MSGPTFNDVRRQYGISLALAWIAMLWRWGLAGPRAARVSRSYRPRRRSRRYRVAGAMRAAEYLVIAIVGCGWLFWAYLIVKGALVYTHGGR
jgi:hypothetical protein